MNCRCIDSLFLTKHFENVHASQNFLNLPSSLIIANNLLGGSVVFFFKNLSLKFSAIFQHVLFSRYHVFETKGL